MYQNLRFIVDKGPGTMVGEPTIILLQNLITEAKDSGADEKRCDNLLGALASARKLSAADALSVAAQLEAIVAR
jgi:hypothetical protein